eukprot:5097695-Amphidinium_carterae.1
MGFPPESRWQGVGTFSHIARLSHPLPVPDKPIPVVFSEMVQQVLSQWYGSRAQPWMSLPEHRQKCCALSENQSPPQAGNNLETWRLAFHGWRSALLYCGTAWV